MGLSSGQGQPVPASTPVNLPSLGFLGVAPWQSQPTYAVYAEVTKDGRKMLLRLAKDSDYVTIWLKAHTGSLITIYVPQLGIAWTSTLSYNKRWKFLYVRIPSRPAILKKLFEPLWKAGYPIPVVVSIAPIPAENLKDGLKPQGVTPRAPVQINRGASAGLGGQAPQDYEVDEV